VTGEELPKARVRRRRVFRLVWVVPILALGVAVYLVWAHMRSLGPEITLRFSDASGLRVGDSRRGSTPVGPSTTTGHGIVLTTRTPRRT